MGRQLVPLHLLGADKWMVIGFSFRAGTLRSNRLSDLFHESTLHYPCTEFVPGNEPCYLQSLAMSNRLSSKARRMISELENKYIIYIGIVRLYLTFLFHKDNRERFINDLILIRRSFEDSSGMI